MGNLHAAPHGALHRRGARWITDPDLAKSRDIVAARSSSIGRA
jgi:hypothetical protein